MITFNNYELASKKLGIGGGFYKLEQGENRMRIVSNPEHVAVHFVDRSVDCLGESCKLCIKKKPTHRFLVYIVDRKDNQVKEAELPWSVFTALGQLSQSTDYKFEGLPPYDINIQKKGELLDTEYTVLPTPNSAPLLPEQIDQLSKLPKLEEVVARRRREAEAYM